MNRRNFIATILGTLATGTGAGLGAASLISGTRSTIGQSFSLPDDTCISPQIMAELKKVASTWPNRLTFAGSRLIKNAFLDEMIQPIRQTPTGKIMVYGGGCDDGVLAVQASRAHIGNLCCPIKGSPASEMNWLPVGHDIKVVVTHPDNPVTNITMGALRDIARGRVRNWKHLGGTERPIALVVHDHCPTYFEPVRTLLLGGADPWSGHRLSATTDEDHLRQVARFPSSIGINSWILAEPLVRRGELKIVHVDGSPPTVASAENGDYPLTGPFNMIFSEWNDGIMRPFFDFLYSPQGQAIISRKAVPISKDKALAQGRPAGYVRQA